MFAKLPVHICLLGASFSTGNLGVDALTNGAIKTICATYPDARVTLLDYGKTGKQVSVSLSDSTVSVDVVDIRFSKRVLLKNHILRLLGTAILLRMPIPQLWRMSIVRRNKWLRALGDVTLFASVAGGDSFTDLYGIQRLAYVCLPQLLALWLGKPLLLLPQTLGPFKSRFGRMLSQYIAKRATLVYSRDHINGREIKALKTSAGASRKLRFCYDLGFVLEPARAVRTTAIRGVIREDGRPLVGLNISGLLFQGGYNRSNMFGLKIDYKALVHDVIEYFVVQEGASVMLVPHVFSEEESDLVASQELYSGCRERYDGRLTLVETTLDCHQAKYVIGQCDFFVGSRMHACIAALSQSVPAIGLAYSDKFIGVMHSVGVEQLIVDLRETSISEALNRIKVGYNIRKTVGDHLFLKMPVVQDMVLGLFNEKTVREILCKSTKT